MIKQNQRSETAKEAKTQLDGSYDLWNPNVYLPTVILKERELFFYNFLAPLPEWILIILDSLILVTLSTPILYLYFYRPISVEIAQCNTTRLAIKKALEDVN